MTKLYIFFIVTCLSSYLVYESVNPKEKNIDIISDNLLEETNSLNEEEQFEIIKTNTIEDEKTSNDDNINKKTIEKELMIIEIPKINIKNKIYNKNSKLNNIDKNVIIMNESDYPDKDSGIVIIGAHSGIGKYAYFKDLNKIDIGDMVYLFYNNKKFSYKVVNSYLDSKDGFISISNVNNKNKLFLYTCNPKDKENYLVVVCESE